MMNTIIYGLSFIFLLMLVPWFAFMLYVTIRDDIRSEKERKNKK